MLIFLSIVLFFSKLNLLKTYASALKKRLFRRDFAEKDASQWSKKASILDETVLAVAQAEQGAASEKEEDFVVPDEFPQDAADANLFLAGKLFAGVDRILEIGKRAVADGLLPDLVAKTVESDTRRSVVTLDDDFHQVFQSLVVVKGVDRICIVIHSGFVLNESANIGNYLKQATFRPLQKHFFTPYINMSRRFRIFAGGKRVNFRFNFVDCFAIQISNFRFKISDLKFKILTGSMVQAMDSETLTLIIIWAIAVVAFFVLWAILLKVVKRISERKNKAEADDDKNAANDPATGEIQPK